MSRQPLKIGILNLMHDKEDTQKRFSRVLRDTGENLEITYFYPVNHYKNREVPELVAKISQPLDLKLVRQMDAFIITGAPLEKLPFSDITYLDELQGLMDTLEKQNISQLYVCWGGMVALNYFYGIHKEMLDAKLFGIYPQKITNQSNLLKGLTNGFLAPHARYAEMNKDDILSSKDLIINAYSSTGHLFLVSAKNKPQHFLFSHLEYGPNAFIKEYHRELNARGGDAVGLVKPTGYFKDDNNMSQPQFTWENTQKKFFKNWITAITNH